MQTITASEATILMARHFAIRYFRHEALRADVMRPSALGAEEITTWRNMQAVSQSLQRAFLSPTFALACERANGHAYVAVLHDASGIRGFFPFQFRSIWHERLHLAERIGGNLCDAAGVIGDRQLRITSPALTELCGLGSLHITHLIEDQRRLGLDATWSDVGHVIDIGQGPEAYVTAMTERSRDFVRDTERRLRRAERKYGNVTMQRQDPIAPAMIAALVERKREQYRRTRVADPFVATRHARLVAALNEGGAPDCRLVLTRLIAGGRVLAQHLGPQHHGVLSYWFPVYDPQARDISPGRLLLWRTIQSATEHGITLIDRGEGDTPYKRELATGTTRYGRASWSGRAVRSLPARAWQSLEWRVQLWRRKAISVLPSFHES